jgi:hypothetical protein
MDSHPPESGFRIEVARCVADGPPWHYEGQAHTPSSSYGVTAVVRGDRTVSVELASGAPPRLAPRVAQLVRSACALSAQQQPPPERIVRWHGGR